MPVVRPIPREVLAYWEAKGLQVGFDHRDVWDQEHDRAFTAARVMREDVLEAMRGSLETAFREGHTYESWVRNLRPELERLGWWQPHQVTDPETGREVTVDPPRRLRIIFDTNMRTARAAGQWERIQRTKEDAPYLVYLIGTAIQHRPEHVSWHGTLLHVDDPWWETHFPPNGWQCHCHVRQLDADQREEMLADGVRNPQGEGRVAVRTEAPPLNLQDVIDPRTGRATQVPAGIDPGFGYRPGSGSARSSGGSGPPTPAPAPTPAPPGASSSSTPTPDVPAPNRIFDAGHAQVLPRMERVEFGAALETATERFRGGAADGDGGAALRQWGEGLVRQQAGGSLTARRAGSRRRAAHPGERVNGRRVEAFHADAAPRLEGAYAPDSGLMVMRDEHVVRLRDAGRKLAANAPLQTEEAHALHVVVHETVHSFGFRSFEDSQRYGSGTGPTGRAVEEIVTETMTRAILRDQMGLTEAQMLRNVSHQASQLFARAIVEVHKEVDIGLSGLSASEAQARVVGWLEEAAVAMRQGSLTASGAPPVGGEPGNEFVWAFVQSIPISGSDAAAARNILYDIAFRLEPLWRETTGS